MRFYLEVIFVAAAVVGSASVCHAQDAVANRFSMEDFAVIEKIDIHFYLHSENTDFVALARRDRFSFLNIATQPASAEIMEQKHRSIFLQYQANRDRVATVSSFSMDGWDAPDWQQKTIRFLDETFDKGAVGVKVWKKIGMVARDRMLAKHRNLPFLAAHLASIEWSVDELAKFLDRFPNAVVDMAARLGQVQYQSQQDRDNVIAFLNKYQDRVLYGTDTGVGQTDQIQERYQQTKQRWLQDWKYFNTDEMVTVPELDEPVQGLALSSQVVEKIYRTNAQRLFPKSWGQSSR